MDTAVGARRRVRRFVLAAEDLRGELGAGGNGELRKPAAQLGLHCAARDVQAATSGRSHDGRAAHQAGLPTSEPAVAGHLGTLAVRARSPRRDAGAVPRAGPTTGPSGRRGRLRREPRRILSPRRRADTEDHDRSPSRVVLVAAAPVDTGRSATEAGPDPSRHDHFAWSPVHDIDQLGDV